MNLDDVYQSKYLKAGDVSETPKSYTITDVNVEEIGRNKDEKLVINFKGEKKGFVCNRTNAKTIAKALGSEETDEWIGKSVKLYSTEVQFGDEMVEAIRVSLKPGTPALEPAGKQKLPVGQDPDDDIPF